MNWFRRKPTHEKQVQATITVASNLYLHTIPGAGDAPVQLQFNLSDSRYRYLIFCLSTVTTACAHEMRDADAVANDCLRFLVSFAAVENSRDFFDGQIDPQDAATNGAGYFQEFLTTWSTCIELEKEGKNSEIIDLICAMVHTTESNAPVEVTDMKRLGELALEIDCRLPTMRGAYVELLGR